jgi:dinuclear metal center YbgI/SA1388 family protein
MISLDELVAWSDRLLNIPAMADFPGADNGLQVANSGKVTRIGAAVDAGLVPFQKAVASGVDFLIVHHGLFWDRPYPFTGIRRDRLATLIQGDCALYSAHLPLDAHPQIGNNVLLAKEIGVVPCGQFGNYQGTPIGTLATWEGSEESLRQRLLALFPDTRSVLPTSPRPIRRIGILTGSGTSAVPQLPEYSIDLFITGELKQNCFNALQEMGIQAYVCGHYATEVFGVRALAELASQQFGVPWEWIDTGCRL